MIKPIALVLAAALSTVALARPAEAQSDRSATSVDVSRFTVSGPGSVNTWWIDAPDGLIVIDFQRDRDAAAQAIERIRASGRPVAALLLTHPHPDHIGGLDQFRHAFPQAPLYASQASANEIRTDGRGYQKLTRTVLGDKAPAAFPMPDRIITSGKAGRIAGMTIVPRELGASEATAATVYYLPASRVLFGGDIAVSGMTDFLLEGRSGAWIRQIETARRRYPQAVVLYPGHGDAGKPGPILDEASALLAVYREEVSRALGRNESGRGTLSESTIKAVAVAVECRLGRRPPVAPIPDLVEQNIKAVAAELNAQASRSDSRKRSRP